MPVYPVRLVVKKRGTKFVRHLSGTITAPDMQTALHHLERRCAPGGEYARRHPDAVFSALQVKPPREEQADAGVEAR